MKLSADTIAILKNFSTINNSLLIKEGKVIRTVNVEKTVLGEASVFEEFPRAFGIYDLPQFLANVSTLDNPDLTFGENSLVMNDGQVSLEYFYCAPAHITSPPDRELVLDAPIASFSLSAEALTKMIKLSSLNSLPVLTINGDASGLYIKAHEKANDSSNSARIRIGDYDRPDPVEVSFKIDNLMMITDHYDVQVGDRFALFENNTKTRKYFIALDLE